MKSLHKLILPAVLLTSIVSCSTYKNSAVTPDDVYYSPGQPVEITNKTEGNNSEYYSTPNENYVKMRVQNPDKWSYFDNYNTDYYGSNYGYGSSVGVSIGFGMGYGYSPYCGGFGYYSPMSYYNSYYAWNSFYNPYYGGVIIVDGKNYTTPSYTRMSNFNPSAYRGSYYNARPSTHYYNANSTRNSQNYPGSNSNSNYNRSTNSRPTYSSPSPMRSAPSNFGGGGSSSGGGGGGASRGGGGSRPGR